MADEFDIVTHLMRPLKDRTPNGLPLVRGALNHAIEELRGLMKAASSDEDRAAYGRAAAFTARALGELD